MATPGPSRVKKEEPDDTKPLLDAEPIEYKLSGAPTWSTSKRLNVMKFSNTATTSKVDLTGWSQPLHLNRRSESALRKMGEDAAASASRSVKTEGGKEEEQQQPRRNPFQKKTQQIKTDESAEVLKMRREERDPWWLEDARPLSSSKAERWTGRLEGTAGAGSAATSHYVLLVLDPESGDFKVVPANRIYNFTKKSNRVTLTAEEADEEFSKRKRTFWAQHAKDGGPRTGAKSESPAPGLALPGRGLLGRAVKKEEEDVKLRSQRDGRKAMRAVAHRELFGSDDEGGGRAKAGDDEQGFDEFDYESDVQDDEEGAGLEHDAAVDEEENRKVEERRKREMRAANRSGSEGLESDGEEARRLLDSAGKRAKKLMRRAGRTEYESDEDPDERNPYASEEERQSSEDDLSSPKSAQNKKSPSKHRSKLPHGSRRSSGQGSARPSLPNSRAGSPAPPAGTGSAMLAKRATSPRHSRAGSPSTPGSSSKRKDRGESEQPGTPGDSSKRVKVEGDRKLTDADIVAFLKRQPGCVAKTVELLKHMKKKLGLDPKDHSKELSEALTRLVDKPEAGVIALKAECR